MEPGHPGPCGFLDSGIKVQDVGEEQGDSEAVTVLRVAEAEIGEDLSGRLQSLLQASFPGIQAAVTSSCRRTFVTSR